MNKKKEYEISYHVDEFLDGDNSALERLLYAVGLGTDDLLKE